MGCDHPVRGAGHRGQRLSGVESPGLEALGAQRVHVNEFGFVYATISSNLPGNSGVQAIGLITHMDTKPGLPGTNMKPIVHENCGGEDIHLFGDSLHRSCRRQASPTKTLVQKRNSMSIAESEPHRSLSAKQQMVPSSSVGLCQDVVVT
jgi:hypothetical protein